MSSAISGGFSSSKDTATCYRFWRPPMSNKTALYEKCPRQSLPCSLIRTTGDLADFRHTYVHFSVFFFCEHTIWAGLIVKMILYPHRVLFCVPWMSNSPVMWCAFTADRSWDISNQHHITRALRMGSTLTWKFHALLADIIRILPSPARAPPPFVARAEQIRSGLGSDFITWLVDLIIDYQRAARARDRFMAYGGNGTLIHSRSSPVLQIISLSV